MAENAPAAAGAAPLAALSTSVRVAITGCPETPAASEKPPQNVSPAQWLHARLAQSVAAFEKTLDAEHEVGFNLVSFGPEVFHAERIGYWSPDLLYFYGRNGAGAPVQLIQHVSQVNVLLVAAKKQQEQPRRIGFEVLAEADAAKTAAGPESVPAGAEHRP